MWLEIPWAWTRRDLAGQSPTDREQALDRPGPESSFERWKTLDFHDATELTLHHALTTMPRRSTEQAEGPIHR
jgi:hypothetical protein